MVTSANVGQRLEELATRLEDVNSNEAAVRFRDLREAVSDGVAADQWAFVDLYRVVDADHAAEVLTARPDDHRWLRRIEVFRSALVLLPLALTWLGISLAVTAYSELIQEAPARAYDSFIYLWQTGFDGRIWLNLGRLAMLDFALLAVVFGLTLWVNLWSSRLDDRRENQTAQLNAEIRTVLADADLLLAERRLPQSYGGILNLQKMAQTLFDDLQLERGRLKSLAEDNQKQISGLENFTAQLETGAKDIATAAGTLQQAHMEMFNNSKDLIVAVSQVSQQQGQLISFAQDAGTKLDTLLAEVTGTVSSLTTVRDDVDGVHTALLAAIDEMKSGVGEIRRSATEIASLVVGVGALAGGLSGLSSELETGTRDIAEAVSSLCQAQTLVADDIRTLNANLTSQLDLQRELVPAVREAGARIRTLLTDQRDAISKLDNVTAQQQQTSDNLANGMQTVAKAMTEAVNASSVIAQASNSLNTTFQDLSVAQSSLISTLQEERDSQVRLAQFVSQSTVNIEQTVQEIAHLGVDLRAIVVDLAGMSQMIPAFTNAAQALHQDVISTYADKGQVTDEISRAVKELALASNAVNQAMQQFEPILNGLLDQTHALGDAVTELQKRVASI